MGGEPAVEPGFTHASNEVCRNRQGTIGCARSNPTNVFAPTTYRLLGLCLQGPLEQPGLSHPLGERGELRPRSVPAQLLHVHEERRVRSQRREPLEEERQLVPLFEHGRRKRLDASVLLEESRCTNRADPRDPWI